MKCKKDINMVELQEVKELLNRIEAYVKLGVKNVLTLEEVALYTGLSKRYICQLASKKQIPAYFIKKEVEAWMKQNRQGPQLETE